MNYKISVALRKILKKMRFKKKNKFQSLKNWHYGDISINNITRCFKIYCKMYLVFPNFSKILKQFIYTFSANKNQKNIKYRYIYIYTNEAFSWIPIILRDCFELVMYHYDPIDCAIYTYYMDMYRILSTCQSRRTFRLNCHW